MARRKGVFVTGTDTGVGKTEVGRAAIALLRDRGLSVGVLKPIETGVGEAGPLDAWALREAAGVDDPIDVLCPQQFSLPAAPTVAAEDENRNVDLDAILRAYESIRADRDFVWVEGAGGLLVPATKTLLMADLAALLELPLLLVVRASLGTINHTLLSLEAIEGRDLDCAGVVISHSAGPTSPADEKNLSALRSQLGTKLLGELPALGPNTDPGRDWLDCERLLGQ